MGGRWDRVKQGQDEMDVCKRERRGGHDYLEAAEEIMEMMGVSVIALIRFHGCVCVWLSGKMEGD